MYLKIGIPMVHFITEPFPSFNNCSPQNSTHPSGIFLPARLDWDGLRQYALHGYGSIGAWDQDPSKRMIQLLNTYMA